MQSQQTAGQTPGLLTGDLNAGTAPFKRKHWEETQENWSSKLELVPSDFTATQIKNGNTQHVRSSACHRHTEKTCHDRNYTDTSFMFLSQSSFPILSLQSPFPELSSQIPFIEANLVIQKDSHCHLSRAHTSAQAASIHHQPVWAV